MVEQGLRVLKVSIPSQVVKAEDSTRVTWALLVIAHIVMVLPKVGVRGKILSKGFHIVGVYSCIVVVPLEQGALHISLALLS